jgi:uncharacterized membrane protein YsdA (DUF1294 family)/cold shock CspA family protein
MRYAGRITEWNDGKGFGFVVPSGGDRAFVRVSQFQQGSRRPATGDLVSYEVGRDGKGRLNARAIRFAGQRTGKPARNHPLPRLKIALAFAVLVAVLAAAGTIPPLLALAYLPASLLSYAMYCLDKNAAEKGYRRTPESTLHFVDLIGGWPGALAAQQQFRHKTVKASFQSVFWITVAANLALVAWLVAGGTAQRIFSSAIVGG